MCMCWRPDFLSILTGSSASRRQSAARLARIDARVANVRADALHKATTGLARRYERLVAVLQEVQGQQQPLLGMALEPVLPPDAGHAGNCSHTLDGA
jgi:hypothetical protein